MSRWILIDIFIELFSIKSRKKLWIFNSLSSSYTLSWSFMFSTCKHITKDNKTIKTLCHFLCLQYVKHMVCWKEHSWWPWLQNINQKYHNLQITKLQIKASYYFLSNHDLYFLKNSINNKNYILNIKQFLILKIAYAIAQIL